MNPLNTVTIRYLQHNKKRMLATILGIALSTLLILSIALFISSYQKNDEQETMAKYGTFHIVVENDEEAWNILKKEEKIASIETISLLTETWLNISDQTYSLRLFTMNEDMLENIPLKYGRLPQNEGEIVIPSSFTSYSTLNLETGDIIDLQDQTYTVVGVSEPHYYESYLGENVMITKGDNTLTDVNYYFVTLKSVSHALEQLGVIATDLGIVPTHGWNGPEYEGVTPNIHLLNVYGEGYYSSPDDMRMGVYLFLLTILAVACILVIYNAFAISVTERKKLYGIFASVGATPGQIIRSVFFEALVTGIPGMILGILLTILMGMIVIKLFNMIGSPVFSTTFELALYPSYYYISLLYIVGIIILSAWLPAMRAGKISPIDAIRSKDDVKRKRRWFHFGIIKRLFGIEGDIAFKNLRRNKKKYRVTTIAISLSIILLVVGNIFFAFIEETTYLGMNLPEMNVNLSFGDSDPDKVRAIETEILNLSSIDKAVIYSGKTNYIGAIDGDEKKNVASFANLITLDSKSYQEYLDYYHIERGRPFIINKIVDEADAEIEISPFTEVPQSILLCTRGENNERDCYKTLDNLEMVPDSLGLLPSTTALTIVVDENTLEEIQNLYEKNMSARSAVIVAKDPFTIEEEINRIFRQYEPSNAFVENYALQIEMMKRTILLIEIVVYGLIGLLTLVALTSVFTTVYTGILLRRKEFAMLRSIGLTKKGFNKMLSLESFFFGMKSFLYGFVISNFFILIINWWIKEMYNPFRDSKLIHLHYPYQTFLIGFLGIFLLTLVTMHYATKQMKQENIIDALTEDTF